MGKNITLDKVKTLLEPILHIIGKKAEKPNWNENDPSSASYIAGRTHYEETVQVEDLTETELEFVSPYSAAGPAYMVSGIEKTLDIAVGDTRTVVWDGVECVCKAKEFNGLAVLGNLSILTNTYEAEAPEDTGEPFIIVVYPADGGGGVEIATLDTSPTHTVRIYGEKTVTHRIPRKYLPDIEKYALADEVYKKQEIYNQGTDTFQFSWGGDTYGRETFMYNAFTFYKISDVAIAYKELSGAESIRSNGNRNLNFYYGKNCYRAGSCIVVENAGRCELEPVGGSGSFMSFNAPSPGVYASIVNNMYPASLTLYGKSEQSGIYIRSGLGEKYEIAVSEDGAPRVSNIDGDIVWEPYAPPSVSTDDVGKFMRVSNNGEWVAADMDPDDPIVQIETITLTESAAIERSAEPDGTTYAFRRIVLMFETPADAVVTAGNIYFYSGSTGVGLGYLAKKDASSSISYLMNDCGPDAGRWLAKYMGGWTGNGNGVYTNNENRRRWLQYAVADYPTLTKVTIPTLPAGTTVQIWGVRANA